MTDLYLDPAQPTEARVADLLARMTLPEKVGQMMQMHTYDGVPHLIEELHVGSILHASPDRLAQAHALVEQTRLRIPLLIGEDCIHGHSFFKGAEIYPTQLGMAATFDPALLERVARATAVEVAATGIHWTFSPVLCIARDLRWGRVSETFGEDPYLLGELGAAMVRGYQGEGLGDRTAILATAKHFAGYSETQGGRDASEADISRRKLRSWYLPPFERMARAGCGTFMLGYQSTDGIPITINEWLLDDVLRGEWGYTGTLITDWDNVGNLVREQRLFPDYAQASAAAVNAGNDMIMTTPAFFEGAQAAVAQGLLDEARIDEAVARILTLKFDLGLFEDPRLPDVDLQHEVVAQPAHRALNLEVARRSLVLLENDGTLPLPADRPLRLAVVGPNADDAHTQLGDWAGASGQADWLMEGHPRELTTTILDGLRALAPEGSEVTYAKGAEIITTGPDPKGAYFPDGQPRPHIAFPVEPDPAMIAEAVEAARGADAVVAVLGDRIELVGEGKSTATLELLGGQVALLDALVGTGTPVVLVVLASKPHVLPPSADRAAAVVWAANPGMAGGRALAEMLLGAIEPSGRLPISWPRHVGQQPTFYNQIDAQHGYRYADLTQEPRWVFGDGLSYSSVAYADLRLASSTLSLDDTIEATVTVTNTGDRPVLETVQAYARDVTTSATWADRELKGMAQVAIGPGASADATVRIPVADCSIVNARGERVVEPGAFQVLVGPTSRLDDLLVADLSVA
ncbi:glycoside hydrolase family 3 N-terminal domain-containing protein [Demequina sp. SYSU T00192]|uniref:beta-glucosidase n=1 Tax=Demequina litoralis TaxID=3051660 RepID=A0ABT8GBP5_9MICO|nr:glycoside hydrolase family 3 N-terminal domain-containing protein [Demequina sp. SYSU T00192]MDN4476560.1 glycoside hydrolase family 3 N-terminal domain-containing protein [Demequina sp. SYSU T00192]